MIISQLSKSVKQGKIHKKDMEENKAFSYSCRNKKNVIYCLQLLK